MTTIHGGSRQMRKTIMLAVALAAMAVPGSALGSDTLRLEGPTFTDLLNPAGPVQVGTSRYRENANGREFQWRLEDMVDVLGNKVPDGAVIDTFVVDLAGNAYFYADGALAPLGATPLNGQAVVGQGRAELRQKTKDGQDVGDLDAAALEVMVDHDTLSLVG